MESITLNKKEIALIKSFVEEITNNPMVETIFVHAFRENDGNADIDQIRVVSIASFYINYLESLHRIERPIQTTGFTEEEWDEYDKMLNKYIRLAAKESDRLVFKGRTHMYYTEFENIGIMTKEMGGGAMLFDRFDNNKCYNRPAKYPYENALNIENVQELFGKCTPKTRRKKKPN